MKLLATILSALLIGCSSLPIAQLSDLSPFECRAYGVDIEDGVSITGTIVRAEFGLYGAMDRECNDGLHTVTFDGCAKPAEGDWPAADNRYEIWYAEQKCVPFHEACHALYESWAHTAGFQVRLYQGDTLPACPS